MFVLLTCSNLKNWITNITLASIFNDAFLVHRETSNVAYIGYQTIEKAFKSIAAHNCQIIKNETPTFGEEAQTKIYVNQSVDYLSKIWEALLVPSDLLKSKRSFYLSVVCSYTNMTVNQWLQLFPSAYEIHKQTNRSRAFVEFSDIFLAEQAQQDMNKKTFKVKTPSGDVNVFVSCFFTSKRTVYNKKKPCSKALIIATQHEEKISNSIVNWLF